MLSIIINHYRTPELLKLCISSIKKNLGSMPHEIIVRDGEALEETVELMREDFPDVLYLPEMENVGFAKLVNDGIVRSEGDRLLVINADIIITDGKAIKTLLEYLDNNPKCGMVGPKLLNLNGTLQQSCFRFYKPLTLLYRRTFFGKTPWGKRDINRFLYADRFQITPFDKTQGRDSRLSKEEAIPVDWLMGSAMLVRLDAVKEVGMFDDAFFMYFEDVDWCRRFWEKGWRVVYDPSATLYHYHGQASKGKRGILDVLMNKYTRIHLTSAFKYFRKYGLAVPRYGV